MLYTHPAIEHDRHVAVAIQHMAPTVAKQQVTPPVCVSLQQCTTSQPPTPPTFLSMPNWTVDETADFLRCRAQTIRKAISQKGEYHGLKPHRFGRRWYFSASDVRSMLEAE